MTPLASSHGPLLDEFLELRKLTGEVGSGVQSRLFDPLLSHDYNSPHRACLQLIAKRCRLAVAIRCKLLTNYFAVRGRREEPVI